MITGVVTFEMISAPELPYSMISSPQSQIWLHIADRSYLQELPQGDRARLLSQLAARVFSHAVGV